MRLYLTYRYTDKKGKTMNTFAQYLYKTDKQLRVELHEAIETFMDFTLANDIRAKAEDEVWTIKAELFWRDR